MRFCFRAVAVMMAVAFALPVVVGQPPGAGVPSEPGTTVTAKPAKPQLTVKVFKLERGDPEGVVLSLNALLEDPDAEVTPPVGPGVSVPGGFGSAPPPAGVGGFGGLPGGLQGGLPAGRQMGFGGIGCFIGNGGLSATPVWRATTHERTRSVIVRGSARHLGVAADVVALYDRAANAPLPKLQVVKAFALKHATAAELGEVISALSFDDVKLTSVDGQVLALVAPDDVAKSVAELVKELDVPGDPEIKPEPKKAPKPNKPPK